MSGYIYFTEDEKQCANNVDLVDFLERQGERFIRSGKEKRLSSDHSITIYGNEWYDHAIDQGGYSIDFVRRFYNLSFPKSVSMLLGREGDKGYLCGKKDKEETKKPFDLPKSHTDMRRVFAYLVKTRFINKDLVTYFAKEKLLYESYEKAKSGMEYHNAVFVGVDENGVARHAYMKGLYTKGEGFKGNVTSSNVSYSFHHVGRSNVLYVFEAPVDMLSFITLYPKDWKRHSYVSLCGVSEHAMVKMLEIYPHLSHVVLCLDNDSVGIAASKKYLDMLSEKQITCEINLPKRKDWSEDLEEKQTVLNYYDINVQGVTHA